MLHIYVPTLPIYIKLKTAHLATVGMVLSMYGLWQAFARIPMGVSGLLMGRGKPLIVSGIFMGVAGAIIISMGNSIFVLAVGKASTGLSASTWVLLVAVFSTFFDEDKAILASSMLTFSASFGRMLATASTGLLNRGGGVQSSLLPFGRMRYSCHNFRIFYTRVPKATEKNIVEISSKSLSAQRCPLAHCSEYCGTSRLLVSYLRVSSHSGPADGSRGCGTKPSHQP